MNILFKVIKKIVFAIIIIYGFNLIVSGMVPINVITILVVTLLGIPGLLSLIILSLIL